MHLTWLSQGGWGQGERPLRVEGLIKDAPPTNDDKAAPPWPPSTPQSAVLLLTSLITACWVTYPSRCLRDSPPLACESTDCFIYWGALGAQTVPGSQPVCVRRREGWTYAQMDRWEDRWAGRRMDGGKGSRGRDIEAWEEKA